MKYTHKFLLALVTLFALPTLAFAQWVGPTATPPGNNASAPINTGAVDQTKLFNGVHGNLILQGGLTTNGFINSGGSIFNGSITNTSGGYYYSPSTNTAFGLNAPGASYLGIGHRIEFFGEDGTLVLHNPGTDYMRGFELFYAKRPGAALERIAVIDPVDAQFPEGRIAPVSRLAKLFFDAIQNGGTAKPGFAEGYRVQTIMDAARRSHNQGKWIDLTSETAAQEQRA